MASVSVSAALPVAPDKAWDALSDLARWEEWLTIHQSWKGELPVEITEGTRLTEVVSVMGMANKIEWTVTSLDAPNSVTIGGAGMAGVQIEFTLSVQPEGEGSKATIDASFTGAMIVGPIGKAVAKSAQADLEASLARLAELVG